MVDKVLLSVLFIGMRKKNLYPSFYTGSPATCVKGILRWLSRFLFTHIDVTIYKQIGLLPEA